MLVSTPAACALAGGNMISSLWRRRFPSTVVFVAVLRAHGHGFVLMVVTFVIMSRMGVFFRFVVVSFTGLTIAGAQQEQSYDPMNRNFFMIVVLFLLVLEIQN